MCIYLSLCMCLSCLWELVQVCFLISTFIFSFPEHCFSGAEMGASEVPRFCACGVGVGEENAPVLGVRGNRCREPYTGRSSSVFVNLESGHVCSLTWVISIMLWWVVAKYLSEKYLLFQRVIFVLCVFFPHDCRGDWKI